MKSLFDRLTRLSLRFRWITLAFVVLVMVAGTIAGGQLKQELLPPIEFPQTFILASASGMNSEQVLKVVTSRVETAVATVPEVVNLSSTTNGAIGAFIIAANDFGLNQDRLRNKIKAAMDTVWFPQRAITAPDGQDPKQFASSLMGEMTPDVLIYISTKNPNFFFQMTPAVWEALPADTVKQVAAYLAGQKSNESGQTALQRLVEQEVVPQLNTIPQVANVQISGGQLLPDEQGALNIAAPVETDAPSLLLQIAPDSWNVIKTKVDGLDKLDDSAVAALHSIEVTVPTTPPALPKSWQMDHFATAADLLEMAAGARTVAGVLNDFLNTGTIKGAPGQTDDLTPETIQKMLEIDPTMVQYFEADQLAAMSPEVFAALPADFVSGLDGFTRDALAAAALAESVTGEKVAHTPVNLPDSWRIQPPQILTFSLASLPLATFSVFDTGTAATATPITGANTTTDAAGNSAAAAAPLLQVVSAIGSLFQNTNQDLQLGDAWSTLAQQPQFATKPLKSADDLLALGGGKASQILNQINASVPAGFAGYEVRLFDSLTPAIINHFAEAEPDFFKNLDAAVLLKFSPEVLKALPEAVVKALDSDTAAKVKAIADGTEPSAGAALAGRYASDVPAGDPNAPELAAIWNSVGKNLGGMELNSADDFFRFSPSAPYKNAAELMNDILAKASSFAPQIFGPLTVEDAQYMLQRDPAVFDDLDVGVLTLFSPEVQAVLPDALKTRISEGAVFRPTATITRTNGASSLLVTVFKDADANTVESFYAVKAVIDKINADNPNIDVTVAFEQSSFVEKSISGVVREGVLGAIFAIVVILVFLSGDSWKITGRRVTGTIIAILFAVLLVVVVGMGANAAGGDIGKAFADSDVLMRFLAIVGLVAGLLIVFFPGSLPYPAWRSTLVIAVSIPLSLFAALAMMHWLPPAVNKALSGAADSSSLITFLLRLFPPSLTLNIMTLSGLTVAIGRVVDDSIVVLENIFRQIQKGMDKREAIISGTRDVSVAIFAATGVAVVVFLPLGLTGGLIGEFFLPFGLAVTYALIASFVVAITVVPVLAFLFISAHDVPHEEETWMERIYIPALKASQRSTSTRIAVIAAALASLVVGVFLFATRPFAFIPDFGEATIGIEVSMPSGTKVLDTNKLVVELEQYLQVSIPADELTTVRSVVGGGGQDISALIGGGASVNESAANISVGIRSNAKIDELLPVIRTKAEEIFGEDNVVISKASFTSGGGFGGFEIFVTGENQAELEQVDAKVIEVLNAVPGLTNVTSNLSQVAAAGGGGSITYLRTDGKPSVSYTAELETEDTIGVTQKAIEAVKKNANLPEGVTVGQGFTSELQSSGFVGVIVAMGIAVVIMIVILVFEFGSPIYWLAVILSISVAPVGAAVALTLTNTVLGISALIGLLMLLGLAVTNAVVLMDRVGSNRYERGMNVYDAIIEAGGRRVRPILMTALATIIALLPLAIGLSEGAIIADSLGKVVIGGMISATLLTLIVVPAAYYLFTPIHDAFMRLFGRGTTVIATEDKAKK